MMVCLYAHLQPNSIIQIHVHKCFYNGHWFCAKEYLSNSLKTACHLCLKLAIQCPLLPTRLKFLGFINLTCNITPNEKTSTPCCENNPLLDFLLAIKNLTSKQSLGEDIDGRFIQIMHYAISVVRNHTKVIYSIQMLVITADSCSNLSML